MQKIDLTINEVKKIELDEYSSMQIENRSGSTVGYSRTEDATVHFHLKNYETILISEDIYAIAYTTNSFLIVEKF